MKKLLIPVLIAVFAGVGGGSGFAYVRASKTYVADSTRIADSLKAHPPAAHDSSAHDSSAVAATAHAAADSGVAVEHVPMTPADSIRALEAARASLNSATRNAPKALPDSATPAHAPTSTPPAPKAGEHAAPAAHTEPSKPGAATASAATLIRDARNDAMNTPLPEQRLAKIFAAMSPKDAAKVMDQMPDADVRQILALMSDRSAAAVLSQFSPTRAATITNGAAHTPVKTPEKTAEKTPGKTP